MSLILVKQHRAFAVLTVFAARNRVELLPHISVKQYITYKSILSSKDLSIFPIYRKDCNLCLGMIYCFYIFLFQKMKKETV